MQVGKLRPTFTSGSSTSGNGKLNFPGFQEVLDFTATGSESSTSCTVDSNTDKEYIILVRNVATGTSSVLLKLNNDGTAGNYGYQYLYNASGSITAARATSNAYFMGESAYKTLSVKHLLTPNGFTKILWNCLNEYSSGTTVGNNSVFGYVHNTTSNITSIDFASSSGNFTSGTRIVVYARRSQT
jgi:hypothetical protein